MAKGGSRGKKCPILIFQYVIELEKTNKMQKNVKEFLLKDLYDVCPQYLLLDEKSYDSLDKQLTDNTLKRAYINGDPILKELSEPK